MKHSGRLHEYNARRDFRKTSEPAGKLSQQSGDKLHFVVQKHAARRLHYDFRLQWQGALLSWAVTRGPSADPTQKRLAVRTEDHPLSYRNFEGTIPKGEYGGGTVMLWDEGTWTPDSDPDEGLEQGKLRFTLKGERMKGSWRLVRMKQSGNKKARENWLLIKADDKFATKDNAPLTETFKASVSSGCSMSQIAEADSPEAENSRRLKPDSGKLPNPDFIAPQLATLVDETPDGDIWLYETKFDGYRCLASIGKRGCRLYSRNGKDWSRKFQGLCQALADPPCQNALLDGEVVAAQESSHSAFSSLQKALKEGGKLLFYAFDLLELDGRDLKDLPLDDRKAELGRLLDVLPPEGSIRLSSSMQGDGSGLLQHVCEAGGEGLIAKRKDGKYRSGRQTQWLKIKCYKHQEFVIGGYSTSSKRSRPFASLLAGQYRDGDLHYRGRVGSGFTDDSLQTLAQKFKALQRKTPAFTQVPAAVNTSARWLSPQLVMEVKFTEFTADGNIRQGVFLGLREDKAATDITPEVAQKTVAQKPVARKAGKHTGDNILSGVRISHGDRIIFPQPQIAKLDLAAFYQRVSKRFLAIASGHPLMVLRCPGGIQGECFYQKHLGKGFPEQLKPVRIEDSSGRDKAYFFVSTASGLIAAVQMGVIEFHLWPSLQSNPEKPDRLVFDLDPDEDLDFARVRQATELVRDCLAGVGLQSVAVLTGGKGIHVCVPLRRTVSWESLTGFAKLFARLLSRHYPQLFTASAAKDKRTNKIYLDWLRNRRGATAVAPYSVRARTGAPVATPVTWHELAECEAANVFSLADVYNRLEDTCPYEAALAERQTLRKDAMQALETLWSS